MKTNGSIYELINKGKYTLFMALLEKGVFFLVFVYFARTTDVKEYGIFVAAFAFANILNSFFEFGFGSYFQREMASRKISITEEFNVAIGFRIIFFGVYSFLTLLYYFYANIPISSLVILISITIYSTGFSSLLSKVLYGLDRYEDSFISLTKSRIIIPIGIFILLIFSFSSIYIIVFLFIAILSQTYFLYQVVKKNGITVSPLFNYSVLKTVLRSSLPMGIGVSFVWIYDKIDVLLIQHYIIIESVSYYSVAYSVYKIPQMISGILLTPLFTDLSQKYSFQKQLYINELLKPFSLLLGFSLSVVVFFNIFPEILLSLIYGDMYIVSGGLLGLLSFALPGLFLNNFTGVMLNSIRQERKAMISAFFAMFVNLVINILLLEKIGIMAAVIATISAEYLIFIIQLYYLYKSKRIKWGK